MDVVDSEAMGSAQNVLGPLAHYCCRLVDMVVVGVATGDTVDAVASHFVEVAGMRMTAVMKPAEGLVEVGGQNSVAGMLASCLKCSNRPRPSFH